MKRTTYIILLLSWFICLPGQSQEEGIRSALQVYDYGRVAQLLDSAADSLPDGLRLDAYKALGRYKEGIHLLETRLAQDTTDRRNYIRLAEFYQYAGDNLKASTAYDRAVDREAPNGYLLNKLASLQLQEGQTEAAIGNLQLALSADTIQPNLRLLARCYESTDSLDRAIALYQTAIRKDSTDYLSVGNLANLYISLDSLEKALRCTEQYIATDSTNLSVNRINAQIYFLTSQYPEALARYRKLTASGDSTVNTMYYQGLTNMNCEKVAEAYENLKYVNRKTKGKVPNILGYLGMAAIDYLLLDEGIEMIQNAIGLLQPDTVQMDMLYSHLAKGYAWKRQDRKKIAMLKKATDYVKRPLTFYNIAYTYDQLKDDKNAEKYYTLFLQLVEQKPSLSPFDQKMKADAQERLIFYKRERFFKEPQK